MELNPHSVFQAASMLNTDQQCICKALSSLNRLLNSTGPSSAVEHKHCVLGGGGAGTRCCHQPALHAVAKGAQLSPASIAAATKDL